MSDETVESDALTPEGRRAVRRDLPTGRRDGPSRRRRARAHLLAGAHERVAGVQVRASASRRRRVFPLIFATWTFRCRRLAPPPRLTSPRRSLVATPSPVPLAQLRAVGEGLHALVRSRARESESGRGRDGSPPDRSFSAYFHDASTPRRGSPRTLLDGAALTTNPTPRHEPTDTICQTGTPPANWTGAAWWAAAACPRRTPRWSWV